MKVKIILDGEIRSCCSSYPPEPVREKTIQSWPGGKAELEVIYKNQVNFRPDNLVELAEKYFVSAIYLLVWAGDKIATLGDIPDEQTLRDILEGKVEYGVTEEDILEEARRHGLDKWSDQTGLSVLSLRSKHLISARVPVFKKLSSRAGSTKLIIRPAAYSQENRTS